MGAPSWMGHKGARRKKRSPDKDRPGFLFSVGTHESINGSRVALGHPDLLLWNENTRGIALSTVESSAPHWFSSGVHLIPSAKASPRSFSFQYHICARPSPCASEGIHTGILTMNSVPLPTSL